MEQNNSRPLVYMNVGIPNSGKSTFSNPLTCPAFEDLRNSLNDTVKLKYISTDYFIEDVANMFNASYNEVFFDLIKFAEKMMYKKLDKCIEQNCTFVWDQTNVTGKIRKEKLAKIPSYYRKVALYYPIELTKALTRNEKRFEKSLPVKVLTDMQTKLERPAYDEGFDDIFIISQNPALGVGYQISREIQTVVQQIQYSK